MTARGHGLLGIQERVKIYGGTMTAETAPGRGFALKTRLPAREPRLMTIRVLVADDQSMIRAGFRMLLKDEEGIEVVAEAEDGLEAVEKASRFSPSVT